MQCNRAKIILQRFGDDFCEDGIKDVLLRIDNISNVYTCPEENMVEFIFYKALDLSQALNNLADMGYPPKDE